jgi:copper homeostasis protein (lipoprotein)
MNKPATLALGLIMLMSACSPVDQGQTATPAVPDPAHNSMNSVDWDGVYHGTVPCADCEGISTVLTLARDLTFTLETVYLGKSDAAFQEKGTFSWTEDGSTVILDLDVELQPTRYHVGENRLTQLDLSGNRITGELADSYVLLKQ